MVISKKILDTCSLLRKLTFLYIFLLQVTLNFLFIDLRHNMKIKAKYTY